MNVNEASPSTEIALVIDYTKYQPGVALSADIVLRPCPICGKPCHEQQKMKTGYDYVHRVAIERRIVRGENRVINDVVCRETVAERDARERGR